MPYESRIPGRGLAPYVERLWALSDASASGLERILPSGTFELVLDLVHDAVEVRRESGGPSRRHAPALVSGAYAHAFVIDARAHRSIVGVHFRPGGAAAFFGACAHELASTHVDLDVLWAAEASSLRAALQEARSTRDRFDILETCLARRVGATAPPGWLSPAVDALLRSASGLDEVARDAGIGPRRFREVFARWVGLSPKRFARVSRMQRALALARCGRPSWAEVALASGYADQPHLVREVRELTGITPTEQPRVRCERLLPNHVLVPSDSFKT